MSDIFNLKDLSTQELKKLIVNPPNKFLLDRYVTEYLTRNEVKSSEKEKKWAIDILANHGKEQISKMQIIDLGNDEIDKIYNIITNDFRSRMKNVKNVRDALMLVVWEKDYIKTMTAEDFVKEDKPDLMALVGQHIVYGRDGLPKKQTSNHAYSMHMEVRCSIILALLNVLTEFYQPTVEDFRELLEINSLIPKDIVLSLAIAMSDICTCLKLDSIRALPILIMHSDRLIRTLAEKEGHLIKRFNDSDNVFENATNLEQYLCRKGKQLQSLGDDLCFELYMMLYSDSEFASKYKLSEKDESYRLSSFAYISNKDRFAPSTKDKGFNLRHQFAHGSFTDADLVHPVYSYNLWWLWLCIAFKGHYDNPFE